MRGDSESAAKGAMEMIGRQKRRPRGLGKGDGFKCAGVDEVAASADAPVEFLAGGGFPAREAADALSHLAV